MIAFLRMRTKGLYFLVYLLKVQSQMDLPGENCVEKSSLEIGFLRTAIKGA